MLFSMMKECFMLTPNGHRQAFDGGQQRHMHARPTGKAVRDQLFFLSIQKARRAPRSPYSGWSALQADLARNMNLRSAGHHYGPVKNLDHEKAKECLPMRLFDPEAC